MSRIITRSLHSTSRAASHIGSAPISIPAGVTVTLPPLSISPSLPASSPAAQRAVHVKGPLGSHTVPIRAPIILESTTAPASSSSSSSALNVSVHDAEEKSQRSLWGLTRTLINNAVVGVAEGYSVDIKLVGVGYRAAVEPIPPVNLNLNKQLRQRREAEGKASAEELAAPLPTDRLNIKLGYAHPILIDIPHGITVTTPATTQIVLKGTDKQRLGLFAAKIRRYRKPEPYRGKVCLSRTTAAGAGPLYFMLMKLLSSQ